jgi:hypothetical protein
VISVPLLTELDSKELHHEDVWSGGLTPPFLTWTVDVEWPPSYPGRFKPGEVAPRAIG